MRASIIFAKHIAEMIKSTAAEWLAKGSCIVKIETYDKKGKFSTTELLNEFKE